MAITIGAAVPHRWTQGQGLAAASSVRLEYRRPRWVSVWSVAAGRAVYRSASLG
jgi:hypothetical protein